MEFSICFVIIFFESFPNLRVALATENITMAQVFFGQLLLNYLVLIMYPGRYEPDQNNYEGFS